MANLIRLRKTHHYGLGEAARSWGGSAAKGGFPHERLHQDNIFTIEQDLDTPIAKSSDYSVRVAAPKELGFLRVKTLNG
ncbi:MAG: hypothetical protein F6J98_21505 [Moorea sp. SIO4G2]|uniref:hypothetical protein n=1 Tax=Moorena sp. SIO3E8 TaxID=2607830 RepID=UPI0013FC3899|nr:hypothetical protein [Moorena sp. SIO3E8]NEO11328.1 hypothetical protein [Moorena sp. SIO3E8]NEO51314.1 hypothetical protein [Moorena sp. SIO4A3]NEO62873.1 hypothetical protein [Moorena sp. SIO4G2]